MIRAFVAIALPEDVQLRLGEISQSLFKLRLDARFVASGSVHLTLKFLGNIEEGEVEKLGEVMQESVQGIPPFEVEMRSLGVFPHPAKPRIVWVGVEGGKKLPELYRRIEMRFEKMGFAREPRPFHPHLTLLRLKSAKNWRDLTRFVAEEGPHQRAGVAAVRAVSLYQSTLRSNGAVYTKLATAELGNGPLTNDR